MNRLDTRDRHAGKASRQAARQRGRVKQSDDGKEVEVRRRRSKQILWTLGRILWMTGDSLDNVMKTSVPR